LITINLERCNGCGACLEVCPDGALYLLDDRPVVDSALCRECKACIAICPTGAIVITDQVGEPTPAAAHAPAVRADMEVIHIKTEPSPTPLRVKVLPVVGAALAWTAREIVPRLAEYWLDRLDRQATEQRAARMGHYIPDNGSPVRGGGSAGRRRRRRRCGN